MSTGRARSRRPRGGRHHGIFSAECGPNLLWAPCRPQRRPHRFRVRLSGQSTLRKLRTL